MKPKGSSRWLTPAVRQMSLGIAAVALLFSLFVGMQMLLAWRGLQASRPIDHPQLLALKEQLGREPGSDALKQELRQTEQLLRAAWFTREHQLQVGAWLLLAGLGSFALAARLAFAGRARLPMPMPRAAGFDPDRAFSLPSRLAVAAGAALLLAAAVAAPILGERAAAVESARGIWARFRGAGGLGISAYANVPLWLDARQGHARNLLWKTLVPLPGMSSPVVWNDRVFATGAIASSREVYCFDALSGRILWRRPVSAGPESAAVPEHVNPDTGFAAPTPVTDGAHVFALFANGDVVCFDLFGVQRWCSNLGLPANLYGLAASPVLHQDRLLLQLDQEPGDAGERSALLALDAATGVEVWRKPRNVSSSWPTPIPIAAAKGVQLLTCANPFVIAYDLADGSERWRVDGLEGDGGPSPTLAEGLVIAVNIGSPLLAIRPDGSGDVTASHVAWKWDDGLPDVCSPLASDGRLWLQATDGRTTCLDARTGALLWQHDHEVGFYASPALAGDRIYLFGRKGKVFVLQSGRDYQLLASGDLGEDCDASPAFADGRIYVRGRRHLFCFREGGS